MSIHNKLEFPYTEPFIISECYPHIELSFFNKIFEYYKNETDEYGQKYSKFVDEIIDDDGKIIKSNCIDFSYDENAFLKYQLFKSGENSNEDQTTKMEFEIYGNKVLKKEIVSYNAPNDNGEYTRRNSYLKSVSEITKDEYLKIFIKNTNEIPFSYEDLSPNLLFSEADNEKIVKRYNEEHIQGNVEFIITSESYEINDYIDIFEKPSKIIINKTFQQFGSIYLLIIYEFYFYYDGINESENKKIHLGYKFHPKPHLTYIKNENQILIHSETTLNLNRFEKWILININDKSIENFYTRSLENF